MDEKNPVAKKQELCGLTPEQYRVTRQNATEAPFANAYWNNKAEGLYVDIISGEPLFSSKDKFDSGTGWPSFTSPVKAQNILLKHDPSLPVPRTEVRSSRSDAHLGHLFTDGPAPTGLRYCINSAALRFIPVEKLVQEGYDAYLPLFKPYQPKKNIATFAAGCFWGVEDSFRKLPGILKTTVGYAGGDTPEPTYEQVCSGRTGHAESLQVEYDANQISYARLLEHFWKLHDPTTLDRQGPDVGAQYRSVVFYHDEQQRKEALAFKAKLEASHLYSRPIVTQIVPAGKFYRAEEYHQNYYGKKHAPACFAPSGK